MRRKDSIRRGGGGGRRHIEPKIPSPADPEAEEVYAAQEMNSTLTNSTVISARFDPSAATNVLSAVEVLREEYDDEDAE